MTVRIAVGGLRPIDHDRLLASFADHPHTEATTGEEVRVLEIQVDDAA